jgi:hypothetical protein
MTKAAKHFGKQLQDFWRNKETAEYLHAMTEVEANMGIPMNALFVAKRGGAPGQAGTWAHPKLAVFFARWLDVRFAVWCDLMVDEILRGRLEVQPVAAPVTQDRGLEDVVKAMLPVLLPEVVRMVAKIAPKDATGPRGGGITAINPQSSP